MQTTVILVIEPAQPLEDLAELVASRGYTIQGVDNCKVVLCVDPDGKHIVPTNLG